MDDHTPRLSPAVIIRPSNSSHPLSVIQQILFTQILEAIIFRGQVFLAQRHRPKGAEGEYSSKERKDLSTIILTNQRTFLSCHGKH
jgi:hypothetical protein